MFAPCCVVDCVHGWAWHEGLHSVVHRVFLRYSVRPANSQYRHHLDATFDKINVEHRCTATRVFEQVLFHVLVYIVELQPEPSTYARAWCAVA